MNESIISFLIRLLVKSNAIYKRPNFGRWGQIGLLIKKNQRRCLRSFAKGERQSDSVLWLRYLESRYLIRVGQKPLTLKLEIDFFTNFITKIYYSSYILIMPQKSTNIIWCYIISTKKVTRFLKKFCGLFTKY